MVICVCGMIGAGKSTFCKGLEGIVSDRDNLENKEKQIEFTLKNSEKSENIYHITCYPTAEEREIFKELDAEYIWINTTIRQCEKNIVERGRTRDIEDLKKTLQKNQEILSKYMHSDIKFKVIDVFETGERW